LAISSDSVAVLSSILSLRNLSIEFHADNEQILNVDTDASEQSLERFSHLEAKFRFAGLRKLSLLGLWGNTRAWRNQILQIVLNSPDLEYLALSLSDDTTYESEDETGEELSPDLPLDTDMFQWLCREYAEATDRQLHFKSTRVDYGIKTPNSISVTGWGNPNGLAKVYIWDEADGPFSQGLEAFPTSDIGAQLYD
jgi:hypothetical protein